MHKALAQILKALKPDFPSALQADGTFSRFTAFPDLHPHAEATLSFPLNEDASASTLTQWINRAQASAHIINNGEPCFDEQFWTLLQAWVAQESSLSKAITHVGVTYEDALAPTVLLRFCAEPGMAFDATLQALELLTGASAQTHRDSLTPFFDVGSGRGFIQHVALSPSSSTSPIRVAVGGLTREEMIPYLHQTGYTSLPEDLVSRISFCFDYADSLLLSVSTAPSASFRFHCSLSTPPEIDPRWTGFVRALCSEGLCTFENGETLLDWSGPLYPSTVAAPWPASLLTRSLLAAPEQLSIIARTLRGITFTYAPEKGFTAIGVLGFEATWHPNSAAATHSPARASHLMQRDFSTENVELAIQSAIRSLVKGRGQGGWWKDFRGLGGMSDAWVTAYVATSLAEAGTPELQKAAQDALHLLLNRRGANEVWGFNIVMPQDADSTSWVLRLSQALGVDPTGRLAFATRFLQDRQNKDGGLATYEPGDAARLSVFFGTTALAGQCHSHDDVTAAGAGVQGLTETYRDYLRNRQQPDGTWRSYWWAEDTYATALAAEALRYQPTSEDTHQIQKAALWASERINDQGGACSPAAEKPSPFATAWCIRLLSMAGSASEELVIRAVTWLLHNQKSDGSWEASARLCIPPPHLIDPEKAQPGTQEYLDIEGHFTTATVLSALLRARDRLT